nr:hypothetical protein [Tanacetum cinerariifolium]
MTRKPSISRRNRIHWHYVRDDALFSTIKVVSRHQATQQYGAILPVELTNNEIRNSKAYQEYYACAMGEAAPKPKASARKKKGKRPLRATTPVEPTDLQRTEAEQLKLVLKRSRQETHISQQQSGSGTGEGTDVGSHEEGNESNDDSDDDDDKEEETAKDDEELKETGIGGDDVRESGGESEEEKETSEEEEVSFDPIPRTPEDSEKESDDEEEQESRLSDEARKDPPLDQTGSRREGGEPESASTPSEPATKSASRSITGTQSRQMSASESTFAEEPVQTTCQMDEPPHPVFETGAEDQLIVQTSQHPEWFSQPRKPPTPDCDWNKTLPTIQGSAQTWISKLAKQADSSSSFNELLDTPIDFSNFIMNRLGVERKSTKRQWINWTGSILKGRKHQQFYGFAVNRKSALDVYSKRRIIAVTDLKIVKWHNYKHLDWISWCVEDLQLGVESYLKRLNLTKPDTYQSDLKRREAYIAYSNPTGFIYQNKDKKNRLMRIDKLHKFSDGTLNDVRNALDDHLKGIISRDDDQIYKFKEGDFKRLRLQDIEDMLLLLVQGKLSNLTVEERLAFNVSLRMFTRSIIIQRRVEDLQL